MRINFELAKKLKEAGFRQGNDNGQECDEWNNDGYYMPTLSELIEECDIYRKKGLKKYNDGYLFLAFHCRVDSSSLWRSGMSIFDFNNNNSVFSDEGYGKTPEEAVANLWLKLNELFRQISNP